MSAACIAPEVNLYLFPDGEVRACCLSTAPLGFIGERSLSEIWHGATRADLVERLGRDDFSAGCQGCGTTIAIEGRAAAYPAYFETLPVAYAPSAWPVRIEFNLSNACNLQCVQCNGNLSSAIRIHRERRPALAKVYDDAFFADLEQFIAHLRCAQFAGGEPFMAPENFRVWEMVLRLNPMLECVVVTNATQWNRRVESILERLPMHVVFSIDGMSQVTYESIRAGADFGEVLRNVERFREIALEQGRTAAINHCLMPQNHQEFGELLLYAEERSMPVNVAVVRDPPGCSIAALPPEQIRRIHEGLLSIEDELLPALRLNAPVWRQEVDRIGRWAATSKDEMEQAVESWATWRTEPLIPRDPLGFPLHGEGPTQEEPVRERLRQRAADGSVHGIGVDEAGRVCDVAPRLCGLLNTVESELLGRPIEEVQSEAFAALGEIEAVAVVSSDDDVTEATVTFPGHRVGVATMAIRDESGTSFAGRILVAFER